MRTSASALGARGEERAAKHLESLGYTIVERNYRCRHGEIDIIARENGDLVFVEVKSRRNTSFGYPSEAVDSRKQRKLALSGEQYLIDRDLGEIDCRFDIAEVYFINGSPVKVEVVRGAFSADTWDGRKGDQ